MQLCLLQDNDLSKDLIERWRTKGRKRKILIKGLLCISVNISQMLCFKEHQLASLFYQLQLLFAVLMYIGCFVGFLVGGIILCSQNI